MPYTNGREDREHDESQIWFVDGSGRAEQWLGRTGCATKNWVKTQTAPIVEHTDQLEDKTAANGQAIRDTDDRAQAGIKQAQGAADTATQNAQSSYASPRAMRRPQRTMPCIAPTRWTAW